MVTRKALPALVLSCLFVLVLINGPSNAYLLKTCQFDAIYQFGDSTTDTGNLIQEDPSSVIAHLPYGETFFKKATGRCSDGLLIVDYFANWCNIPLLDAFLNPNATFSRGHGVNFAVAGSTALPIEVLAKMKISSPITNSSLSIQLDWMFTYLKGLCYNQNDCAEKLKSSLFMLGGIGSNDYDFALLQGKTIEELQAMVPQVVKAIKDAATRLIGYGGRRLLIPGNFPIGCLPYYLTKFQTNNTSAYDRLHCLRGWNNFSVYHNEHLKQAIQQLKQEHPNVTIVYGDYYNSFLWVLSHAQSLGFDVKSLQKSCCGAGGDYNFNLMKLCGSPGVLVCQDPDQHISWDGIHLTQRAHEFMARWIVDDIFPQLNCPASKLD